MFCDFTGFLLNVNTLTFIAHPECLSYSDALKSSLLDSHTAQDPAASPTAP